MKTKKTKKLARTARPGGKVVAKKPAPKKKHLPAKKHLAAAKVSGVKKFTHEEYKNIYSKVPRLCVDLLLTSSEGVLLTKRAIEPYMGQWHLPGGTVFVGETLEEAVLRVAKEELGIMVEVVDELGVIEYDNEPFGKSVSIVFWVVACEEEMKKIRLNEQASEWAFFDEEPENTVDEQAHFIGDWFEEMFAEKEGGEDDGCELCEAMGEGDVEEVCCEEGCEDDKCEGCKSEM